VNAVHPAGRSSLADRGGLQPQRGQLRKLDHRVLSLSQHRDRGIQMSLAERRYVGLRFSATPGRDVHANHGAEEGVTGVTRTRNNPALALT
jgi:hypothetical protein